MVRNAAIVLIALTLAAPAAYAGAPAAQPPPTNIRALIENIRFDPPGPVHSAAAAQQTTHHYSVATKASAGVAMGILGALVGAIVSSPRMYVTGPATPAYVGAAGGAAGAIAGVWLASR